MGSTVGLAPELLRELLPVAAKVFWWGTPEESLQDVPRFVAQVMTFGDWRDVRTTMRLLGSEEFESVLGNPPRAFLTKNPGIIGTPTSGDTLCQHCRTGNYEVVPGSSGHPPRTPKEF